MKHIKFRYKDEYSKGEWSYQECIVESVRECIKLYGLDQPDVEYEILSVEEVE